MKTHHALSIAAALLGAILLPTRSVVAQINAEERGSDNVEVLAHLPLGEFRTISDVEVEQDMTRPYAYVGRQLASGMLHVNGYYVHPLCPTLSARGAVQPRLAAPPRRP